MPPFVRCVLTAALILCVSASAAVASPLRPGQSWAGDGSTGSLSQWSYVEQCPNDISVVGSPAPAGAHAFEFHVSDGDVMSKCPGHVFTPQPAASLISPTVFHAGTDAWVGFSTYFPAGFPYIPHWFQFAELDGRPFGGSPPVGLDVVGNRIGLFRDATHNFDNPWSTPVVTGQWEDFVLHVKFSTDASVGFVELYLNGVQQRFDDGSTRLYYATLVNGNNYNGVTGDYLDLDQYRSMYDTFGSLTIYEAEAGIGSSYAAVAPQLHYGIVSSPGSRGGIPVAAPRRISGHSTRVMTSQRKHAVKHPVHKKHPKRKHRRGKAASR